MKNKALLSMMLVLASALLFAACGNGSTDGGETAKTNEEGQVTAGTNTEESAAVADTDKQIAAVDTDKQMAADVVASGAVYEGTVKIALADGNITVDGGAASTDAEAAVYLSNDIIYYEEKDQYESGNPYGEGTDADKHTADEAAAHTVVNITHPGTYHLTGTLSAGQIFVNVGEEETDTVTLILDGVDITCTVAPAVMFYEVYECDADASEETASYEVDTSNAGAKVVIADDSVNKVTGSYVARIFEDNGEEKKLHKYDGAFYSKMSMEVAGGEQGNGVLNIQAENEGLDSELHLSINGGNINIQSANDGINVNEDNISVFTMNDGSLNISATSGEEGDGIDSNGWLVVNGGMIAANANPKSADAGIDSDKGIYINGGTVIACGNMYDHVETESAANTMVFQFASEAKGNIQVMDESGNEVMSFGCADNYSSIVLSSELLKEGTYSVQRDGVTLSHTGSGMRGMGNRPEGMEQGELPEGMEKPERGELPEGTEFPEGMEKPERGELPEGMTPPEGTELPERGEHPQGEAAAGESSTEFVVEKGANLFGGMV